MLDHHHLTGVAGCVPPPVGDRLDVIQDGILISIQVFYLGYFYIIFIYFFVYLFEPSKRSQMPTLYFAENTNSHLKGLNKKVAVQRTGSNQADDPDSI